MFALVTGVQTCALPIYRGRPLEHIKFFGPLRQMRDGLNRRASGTDDRHTLVAQVRQLGVIRRAAGVIIVPTRVEEYFPFEVRKTLDRRQLRDRKSTRLNSSH